ncbi:MAG TPA: YcaO-like family protein [Candidatus Melainabacteria bacterium]|nr:YcaO-like family protein [Candidatus Melainabacteria bacterium]
MPVKFPEKLGTLAPVLDLIDDRFGPVKDIVGIKPKGKQPPFWIYHATLTRPLGAHFVEYDCDAWGASIDKDEALFKCLGEVLERYCMYNTFATGQFATLLARECKLLEQLPRCAESEPCADSFKKISPDWFLTMAQVKEVANGELHWLPAGFVDFTYQSSAHEPKVTLSHSSGSAFHESLHRAIWAGLCEVAERDAFSLFWLNQLPAREIVLDNLGLHSRSKDLSALARRLESIKNAGLRARTFDITTDFNVPTVFTVVQGDEYPYATFGAACSADPVKAIVKSIDEVFLVRLAQLSGKQSAKVPSFTEFSWVASLRDHSDLYALWKDTPAFDFFMKDAGKISLIDFQQRDWWSEPDNFSQLQDHCRMMQERLGMTVLYMDCTLDDVARFGAGVKVVVPQMQPIYVPQTLKWLACPRLARHAEKHSLKFASNPYPHPFP